MEPRSTRQRLIRRAANILLIAGGLILAFPFWSAAYTSYQQGRLSTAYDASSAAFVKIAKSHATALAALQSTDLRVRFLADLFGKDLRAGQPIGRLRIPSIGVNDIVVQGSGNPGGGLSPSGDSGLLRGGPVHYAGTPLPGAGRPFAAAGHRTTYAAPFYRLNELRRGDRITLDTPYAHFSYTVAKSTTVLPNDTGALFDRGYDLVLTTCTPLYSASHRLVVWATVSSATPR